VTTKASGKSGKIQALEYLNSQDSKFVLEWWPFAKKLVSLEGINLTPAALVEQWENRIGPDRTISWVDCPDSTYSDGVELPNPKMNKAKLPCALLNEANLDGADLEGAYLNGANLKPASLKPASLNMAILTGAGLTRANLGGAIVTEADLREEELFGPPPSDKADRSWANLDWAGMSEATFCGTTMPDGIINNDDCEE
jgi:uncharacterized protein YjbI with pentapeptide repeats